ncbi:MAG TPA: DUF2089 domain-containing protein [Symbiobacteriaceae bacterium]|nr:DUF2089 domain-containing protein [Symbiobacteriaceae bacterium]
MRARRMISRCPVCSEELVVTRLRCQHCETTIEGAFEISRFARLSKEQLEFVEIFLKSRGNIKEVERELGISYPTVRGRLDTVLEALGYRVEPAVAEEVSQAKANRRKEILDALNRGDLSSEEAIKQLRTL